MPGEPRTRRGRASRERIIERAADLFAERGIAATSVDEVLAAAKAGKGQFYHYFRSRDELAAAAVGYRCAQVVDGLTQALGDVSSLAGLEQALAGSCAGFERARDSRMPDRDAGSKVASRNKAARSAAAGFDAWSGCWLTRWSGCASAGTARGRRSPACWPPACWPASRAGWCSARPART